MQEPDIEAIRQLKARYCRLLDTKQWEQWADVFTEDFNGLYEGPHPDVHVSGRDEIVSKNRELLAGVVTVHQCFNPEIDITGSTSASGVWAMYDRVELPGNAFEGYGHYYEEYRKEDGHWRISRIHLRRLRVVPLLPAQVAAGQ